MLADGRGKGGAMLGWNHCHWFIFPDAHLPLDAGKISKNSLVIGGFQIHF
jgi:hypothetical protein